MRDRARTTARVAVRRPSPLHLLLAATLLLAAWLALPAGAGAASIELTPFIGYSFGDEFSEDAQPFAPTELELDDSSTYGLILGIGITRNFFVELEAARQETDIFTRSSFLGPQIEPIALDEETYHVGLLYQWAPGDVRPFVRASLGATRFDPELDVFADETRFSFAFGGGVKLMLSDGFGVRFEGRYLSTLVDEDDRLVCDPHGFCFEEAIGEYLEQLEARGGLVFHF